MNIEYIENLRYKLQKRIDKIKNFDNNHKIFFHNLVKQYWFFLQENLDVANILNELSYHFSYIQNEVDIVSNSFKIYDTETENAAACYFTLQKLVAQNDDPEIINRLTPYIDKNQFIFAFLTTLHEYIDEKLSDRKFMISLLSRYKYKCEWFQRKYLLTLWESNSGKGEKLLTSHLYEYLYDQGLNFTIEPYSISGEVDLIGDQKGDHRLIAEAKIFNGNKHYIAKGFRQIYQYLLDYNQSLGYLIIYQVCDNELRFSLPDKLSFIPFITHNYKTIFFLVIDIFPHKTSASKRGLLKSIEITEDDLIQILREV